MDCQKIKNKGHREVAITFFEHIQISVIFFPIFYDELLKKKANLSWFPSRRSDSVSSKYGSSAMIEHCAFLP